MQEYQKGTQCLHAGYVPESGEPRNIPIVQSTTFRYGSSEAMGALFDLEAEGYFCSVPGKGSFAAPHTGVDQARRDSLLGHFDTVTAELLYLGVTGEQLTARVRAMEGGDSQ